jgi:hypothetical protein
MCTLPLPPSSSASSSSDAITLARKSSCLQQRQLTCSKTC